MSNHLEELQSKKYIEFLISVDATQWQFFSREHCFEVGDAAARPRVYFDVQEQYGTYALTLFLEVDGETVGSSLIHVGKAAPLTHDDLLLHMLEIEQPPQLLVLFVRLLRHRSTMATEPRPEHVRAKLDNYMTVLKQKVLVDWPHNMQERFMIYRVERNASRVLPKARRG